MLCWVAVAAWLLREVAGSEGLSVLEVGAGDGKLALHLRSVLADAPVEICATDSFSRGLSLAAGVEVRRADYRTALAEQLPDVVLCSWMPLGEDWTEAFRACGSVRAYVLLGEVEDGCCGRPWKTWGYVVLILLAIRRRLGGSGWCAEGCHQQLGPQTQSVGTGCTSMRRGELRGARAAGEGSSWRT